MNVRDITARSYDQCCNGRAISITNSKCASVSLVIRHIMRMRRIVICGLTGSTTFFPNYHINGILLGKEVRQCKMCFFSITFSEIFPILRRIQRNIIINYIGLQVPVIVVRFL